MNHTKTKLTRKKIVRIVVLVLALGYLVVFFLNLNNDRGGNHRVDTRAALYTSQNRVSDSIKSFTSEQASIKASAEQPIVKVQTVNSKLSSAQDLLKAEQDNVNSIQYNITFKNFFNRSENRQLKRLKTSLEDEYRIIQEYYYQLALQYEAAEQLEIDFRDGELSPEDLTRYSNGIQAAHKYMEDAPIHAYFSSHRESTHYIIVYTNSVATKASQAAARGSFYNSQSLMSNFRKFYLEDTTLINKQLNDLHTGLHR